jgi:hypothetical protein
MKRPKCERKGTLPHPATKALIWNLPSGRVTKFFCDAHAEDASHQPYYVSELIGYCQRVKVATEED